MEYTVLGSTGMRVSRICLGCLGFGSSDWRPWVLDREESHPILERALDLGINFFNTADLYSDGESERILGEALEGHWDESVVATLRILNRDPDRPNYGGLSRKGIEQALEGSLNRLGTDTIDLYQIQRWDDRTPIETTMRALDDAVRCGHVREIGASSMWAHQFAQALSTSDQLAFERFATMQNHYNLAYREEEREMLPLCAREGIAVIPWSPLARGYLTRPADQLRATTRGQSDDIIDAQPYRSGGGPEINERVQEVAADEGVSMAQIALAWLLHKEPVTAPIVGVTSEEHLVEAVEAVDIGLSDGDIAYLEEPYEPVPVSGHT